MQQALLVQRHVLAVQAASLLTRVLPGMKLPKGIKISTRHRDGRLPVADDDDVVRLFQNLRNGTEAAGVGRDLPFHDLTSWLEFCASKGVAGRKSARGEARTHRGAPRSRPGAAASGTPSRGDHAGLTAPASFWQPGDPFPWNVGLAFMRKWARPEKHAQHAP